MKADKHYIKRLSVDVRIRELEAEIKLITKQKDSLFGGSPYFISQHTKCLEEIKERNDKIEVLRGLLEKKEVLYIRPAPGTCCPEMNIKKGVCLGCGTKKKKPEKT